MILKGDFCDVLEIIGFSLLGFSFICLIVGMLLCCLDYKGIIHIQEDL